MESIKLSPSELTFLWDECRRCFYLKVMRKFMRPSLAFPKIFGSIDKKMKEYYAGRSPSEISPDLPEGQIFVSEKYVTSKPIELLGHSLRCYFSGRIDAYMRFEDGSFGVIDFKTSDPAPAHIGFYNRQLQAYKYALEHPAPGKVGYAPITRMGLVYFTPESMAPAENVPLALNGRMTWQEMKPDDEKFMAFLGEVLTVLESPEPPEPSEDCPFCAYRASARETGF